VIITEQQSYEEYVVFLSLFHIFYVDPSMWVSVWLGCDVLSVVFVTDDSMYTEIYIYIRNGTQIPHFLCVRMYDIVDT